jgi:hypothetical protein
MSCLTLQPQRVTSQSKKTQNTMRISILLVFAVGWAVIDNVNFPDNFPVTNLWVAKLQQKEFGVPTINQKVETHQAPLSELINPSFEGIIQGCRWLF